jgi:hypothetical protein
MRFVLNTASTRFGSGRAQADGPPNRQTTHSTDSRVARAPPQDGSGKRSDGGLAQSTASARVWKAVQQSTHSTRFDNGRRVVGRVWKAVRRWPGAEHSQRKVRQRPGARAWPGCIVRSVCTLLPAPSVAMYVPAAPPRHARPAHPHTVRAAAVSHPTTQRTHCPTQLLNYPTTQQTRCAPTDCARAAAMSHPRRRKPLRR